MPEPTSRSTRRRRHFPARVLTAIAVLTSCGCASARAGSDAPPADPCLRLDTAQGALVIRFSRAAAPQAVSAIEKLARGPLYNPAVVPRPEAANAIGYFDGLAFDFARPHLELRLATRPPEEAFTVEAEIDATALGLDRQTVRDAGEAMNEMQMEIWPALQRADAGHPATATLQDWGRRYMKGYDATFLIGKTRQELLEALGYRYRTGLASLRPEKGTVALVPASPTSARLTLSIQLADLPARLGRWVVVGRVISGLEIADAISERPLESPRNQDFYPRDPVVVERSRLDDQCNGPSQGERP